MPQQQSAWQRRFRRLLFLAGTVSAVYFASSYMLDRMREASVRAAREKRRLDLLKSHFTSLLSTLSFTLYALLPTLGPQLAARYPVEQISGALQGLSNPASSQASVDPTPDATPSVGATRPSRGTVPTAGESLTETSPSRGAPTAGGPGESWASEFNRRESEAESGFGSEVLSVPETDEISSVASQTISLPPTDMSSASGSPHSDISHGVQLHPSPPRAPAATSSRLEVPSTNWESKSKKELWRDLKIHSLTRALTTAYLLPLLYVLTASQLSTLARMRYIHDLKAALPPSPAPSPAKSAPTTRRSAPKGWLSSLSIEGLGLSEFVEETTSLMPNPTNLLPGVITSRLPSWMVSSPAAPPTAVFDAEREMDEEAERAEAERVYLTYSWWILHEGWKEVADRVEEGVERVFGGMGLKRDLSVSDWDGLIREVRLSLDLDDGLPHSWTYHILPPTPLPAVGIDCPLPIAPSSPHLASLLAQTRDHLESPDARYLLQRGVDAMVKHLLIALSDECYELKAGGSRFLQSIPTVSGAGEEKGTRRLVDCLPEINRWGKAVWEGVPDGGVEALLVLPEFESFAALIFGDWAPR